MLFQILLSEGTVKGRIDELSQNIREKSMKDQLFDLIKHFPFFAISYSAIKRRIMKIVLGFCFMLVSRQFNGKEEMLFCHLIKSCATLADIFNVVSNFFRKCGLLKNYRGDQNSLI